VRSNTGVRKKAHELSSGDKTIEWFFNPVFKKKEELKIRARLLKTERLQTITASLKKERKQNGEEWGRRCKKSRMGLGGKVTYKKKELRRKAIDPSGKA